jgi:sugar lactone lactonase YvrE
MIDRRMMLALGGGALALSMAAAEASEAGLQVAASFPDSVCNGVATTADGRVFATLARIDGSAGPRVVEIKDGEPTPYPDAGWNGYSSEADPARTLVWVNSLRIGPDGDLWLVDTGSPGFGQSMRPGGCKLVQIDVTTNRVRRTVSLDSVITPQSFVDDVRFKSNLAYLTDAGDPALMVLDLASGTGRRLLEGHASVTARRPVSAEGHILHGPDDKPVFVHADQLELSPDGQWLFFQACSGPLYRVPTRLLDDHATTPAALAGAVEFVADTPSTGGTAVAADGTLFVSDTDTQRIITVLPDGTMTTLIQDPRLLWVDAMWFDAAGRLWLPPHSSTDSQPFRAAFRVFSSRSKSTRLRPAPDLPRTTTRETCCRRTAAPADFR